MVFSNQIADKNMLGYGGPSRYLRVGGRVLVPPCRRLCAGVTRNAGKDDDTTVMFFTLQRFGHFTT